MTSEADVLVVGAGLAGLVATAELVAVGRRVILVDQEPEASLGGQAFWSFGGLFLVGTPEQRRLRVRDSAELAWQDWLGSAGFDRECDHWPRQWAWAYVDFAAGPMRSWLHGHGVRWFPLVQWAERGVCGRGVRRGAGSVPQLVAGMNELVGQPLVDAAELERVLAARDGQVASGLGKDAQVTATLAARNFLTDRLVRLAKPHRLLDPAAGPLIAVRLSILTRKTLGGLETDLSGRVLRPSGEPLDGVYAAGEVSGFGGGGIHGYRALEGTLTASDAVEVPFTAIDRSGGYAMGRSVGAIGYGSTSRPVR
jgi:predicted oxidoreductase